MKEYTFERVDEKIYKEVLDNGLEVYLYKTDKTKNFYITISVKYGARITKYKVNDKVVDVIPGSAHFLEHKVMALSENKEISKRINELGSIANAWTSYYGTNYNIFGSINPIENLKLLLDIFYHTNITEQSVEEEKGIIGEEIDMYKDEINSELQHKLYNSLFTKTYPRNTVVGEREDIAKITAKSLNEIYNDYYVPNNTFIVVTGNFDKDEAMTTIKDYMKNIKVKRKDLPKRIKERESEKVNIEYTEVKKDMENTRVKYSFKMKKNIFGVKDDNILKDYLGIILSSNVGPSSPLYEKYKDNDIMIGMSFNLSTIDDYLIITINALTNDGNKFINNIEKDIKNLKITEEEFERKKKKYAKGYILDFDNIEDVEYLISLSLMIDNKIDYKEYNKLMNMDYKEAKRIIKLINYDNISIVRTIK